VTYQPNFYNGFGSGAGIRTLNLAVNRSLKPVQKWRPEFAEYRLLPPDIKVCHRRAVRKRARPQLPHGFEDRSLTSQS
jgi:hypothetical protein